MVFIKVFHKPMLMTNSSHICYNMLMDFLDLGNRINAFYIISQIFAFLATTFSLIAVQKRKKVQLLKYDTFASTCATLHYLFLGAWSGAASKTITTIRNIIATNKASKNKTSKIIPAIFVILYIISGIISFQNIFSILPILASCIYAVAIYTVDVSKIRKFALLGSCLWLLYDICVFSIVGIIAECIFIADDLTAIYRFRKKKNSKTKKR